MPPNSTNYLNFINKGSGFTGFLNTAPWNMKVNEKKQDWNRDLQIHTCSEPPGPTRAEQRTKSYSELHECKKETSHQTQELTCVTILLLEIVSKAPTTHQFRSCPREDLKVHCPYRFPELQSQKIQTAFLLHTPLKDVAKEVTTGTTEGAEQEDRLKTALCRTWNTKCNRRAASLFPSSNEVFQEQQIGREPGWVRNNLWRCQRSSTWTKKQASNGIQTRNGTKRKRIPLKHLITCFP